MTRRIVERIDLGISIVNSYGNLCDICMAFCEEEISPLKTKTSIKFLKKIWNSKDNIQRELEYHDVKELQKKIDTPEKWLEIMELRKKLDLLCQLPKETRDILLGRK